MTAAAQLNPLQIGDHPPQPSQRCSPCSKIVALVKRVLQAIAAYLLKLSFFQTVPGTGRFSRWIMAPVARTVLKIWQMTQGIPGHRTAFEAERLEKARAFLSPFGEWKETRSPDGAVIQWGHFTAAKFNQWLEENGGVREGEWIRPRAPADWARLQKLDEFKWFEKAGQAFRVPAPLPGAQGKCVLQCPGFGRKMPMNKAFVGLHIAAGFDFALFNWRNDFYDGGIFDNAEAVYQAVRAEGYAPNQIKVTASCRSTLAAGRLMELHRAEGTDTILIHPPTSLKDVVENQNGIAAYVGLAGVPVLEEEQGHLDTARRIRELPLGPGRLAVVLSEGDKTLPVDTQEKIEEAARASNLDLQVIMERHVPGAPDPHFAEPLKNGDVQRAYLQYLASAPA